jgi:hypothetical protein
MRRACTEWAIPAACVFLLAALALLTHSWAAARYCGRSARPGGASVVATAAPVTPLRVSDADGL